MCVCVCVCVAERGGAWVKVQGGDRVELLGKVGITL